RRRRAGAAVPHGGYDELEHVLVFIRVPAEFLAIQRRPDVALPHRAVADDAVFGVRDQPALDQVLNMGLLGRGHSCALEREIDAPRDDERPCKYEDDDVLSPVHWGTTPFTAPTGRQSSSSTASSCLPSIHLWAKYISANPKKNSVNTSNSSMTSDTMYMPRRPPHTGVTSSGEWRGRSRMAPVLTRSRPLRTSTCMTSIGRGAGPAMFCPVGSYTEPWHGQMKSCSLSTHGTVQPRCGQRQ